MLQKWNGFSKTHLALMRAATMPGSPMLAASIRAVDLEESTRSSDALPAIRTWRGGIGAVQKRS